MIRICLEIKVSRHDCFDDYKYQQLYYLAINVNRYLIVFGIYLIIIWRFKRELFRTISARTVSTLKRRFQQRQDFNDELRRQGLCLWLIPALAMSPKATRYFRGFFGSGSEHPSVPDY